MKRKRSFSYRPVFAVFLLTLVGLLLVACSGSSIPNTGATAPAVNSTAPSPAETQPSLPVQPASPTGTQAATSLPAPISAATSGPTQAAPAAASCSSPAAPTIAMTEGPYFKAGSPERASLVDSGIAGTHLILTGTVLTPDCKPIPGALLVFWQADSQGQYDNSGYTLRGHQFTDASGHYRLETVIPGEYPGRTEHIHVKVQAPNGPILTTQLFFPGVAHNASDSIFDQSLLVTITGSQDGVQATYNFIVNPK